MQSVTRAFDVLFAVARADRPPTVGSLASTVDLPRSTVHRILDTLIATGVVARTGSEKAYVVTPKLALATSVNRNTATLADTMMPFLHQLVAISEETSSLHVRVGDLRVCVAEVEGSRGIRWARGSGWSAPIWAGCAGHMLMADMGRADLDGVIARSHLHGLARNTITSEAALRHRIEEVRMQGWSTSESETVDGAAAVAAPVVTEGGQTVAVLSLYAAADRLEHMMSLESELRATAGEAGAAWDAISAFPASLGRKDLSSAL
jgi:DNA-binding IclR family transcriptional regulator